MACPVTHLLSVGVHTIHTTSQHNTTHHNTTLHNTTLHNTTQHCTTQHNTTQHNTTQHNTAHQSNGVSSTHLLSVGVHPVAQRQMQHLLAGQAVARRDGHIAGVDALGVVPLALVLQPLSSRLQNRAGDRSGVKVQTIGQREKEKNRGRDRDRETQRERHTDRNKESPCTLR
eukprot:TRINITY_DN55017_c0_g2_i2.p1 TRINITY_DN55017_c0_g2~~TRINITY_DN55017_c0_g2_i2.p1  ORF type:complete len:172 (+),score=42.88 TRINITY_DN55017_c0_g2_i2:61-576(+)